MEARRLDLLGLLIQPVQRIPRYQMLLEDLRRRSPEDHPDYQNLTLAIAEITRIANEVNAQMDKEENFLKMYKIQASFIGNVKCLVKEGRVFVREGALIKMCRKVPKKRWFFLFNDALVYGSLVGADKAEKASVYTRETAGKTSNRYTFHRMIEFGSGRQGEKNRDTFKVRDIPDSGDEKYAFQIIRHARTTYSLPSCPEKEAWMVDLQQQLATQGAATGEDEGAPVWIPDNKATDCQISKKARLSKLKTEKAVRVCTFCYNWLHTKEGEGDEESVHGAEGDESSEDKRNSGREEAKEESENEDDENNKKKPSATKKQKKEKKEKKERTRDKLGNLLSWRSDDHKRPTGNNFARLLGSYSGKSPRHGDTKEREGLDFEPVQMPSPPLSSEGPKPHSGDHASVQASSAAPVPEKDKASTVQNEEPAQAHHPLAEEQQHQHQQQREGAEAEHKSEKEQEEKEEKEEKKEEKEMEKEEKEKEKEKEKETKQSKEVTPPSTPQPATATASSVLWRRSSITPGRTSPAPLLFNAAAAAASSPAATPTSSSLSSPNRPASPALSRVSNRGQRMSIGLERVKLQAALALEAANESNQ
ncbi:Zn fingercontaining protein [Acanthamoeba castellanii str. Neff]|uniref:Zn fingercontaining protein n=1 Tax=Acanthamoeba castellanii (strain ATCC 30010 / Neff) TaxID=1257118 RepID=L8GHT1_ACACF|nr:Zn fingercontaining protein [Acanthamoeba castellanii str. Neff]ELR12419.1 Zn fingercontaining protein [Acanthamoeba castellanii str. Neff]